MPQRKLTVYAGSSKNTYVPQIILQGNWLKLLGFDIGDKVTVDCQQDRLIIIKSITSQGEKKLWKKIAY